MPTLTEAMEDIIAMRKRGAVTDEELKRLVRYLVDPTPNGGNGISPEPPTPAAPPRRQRRNVGRGSSGWVDRIQAQVLDLVAMLELADDVTRPQVRDHVEQRWGHHFTENDLQVLTIALEARWEKNCNFAFHYLGKDGYIIRRSRGVYALTDAGRRQAEAWRKSLPH